MAVGGSGHASSNLQLDLDFYESAFPSSAATKSKILSKTIDIPAFSDVDVTASEFLSGSNLVFDPGNRTVDSFGFYKGDDSSLSLEKMQDDDPFAYSLFDYIGTYGSVFIPDVESEKLKSGVMFEKVVCLLIDDDDFEISFDMEQEDSRSTVSEVRAQLRSEKQVAVGEPTSNGVDLSTYRFSIEVGSSESFKTEGG